MPQIKRWQIIGFIITVITGSLLHFAFEWGGQLKPVALIAAVNESSWEHLKLAFWPTFFFAVIEWFSWGKRNLNFCLATMVKLFSMPLIILALFYGWLLFFEDSLIWDISIFVLAIAVGYYLGYRILASQKQYNLEQISPVLIFILLIAFSLLTYFPPRNFLFQDPVTGGYGIVKD